MVTHTRTPHIRSHNHPYSSSVLSMMGTYYIYELTTSRIYIYKIYPLNGTRLATYTRVKRTERKGVLLVEKQKVTQTINEKKYSHTFSECVYNDYSSRDFIQGTRVRRCLSATRLLTFFFGVSLLNLTHL